MIVVCKLGLKQDTSEQQGLAAAIPDYLIGGLNGGCIAADSYPEIGGN
jgi:hypothetical protein